MKILKRDGRSVEFILEKIEKAIRCAFNAVNMTLTEDAIDVSTKIAHSVEAELLRNPGHMYSVEEIQDLVEDKLMSSSFKDVARAYIIYRNERTKVRARNSELRKSLRSKLKASDVQNQNANIDEKSFGGRVGEASSVVLKEMALDELISPVHRQNHLENRIYLHDLDAYYVGTHNCLFVPFTQLLSKNVSTRQTDIRPAGSINTAMQLVAVYFQIQSLQQFGGVGASTIDFELEPYIRKSFWKHFRDGLIYFNDYPTTLEVSLKNFPKEKDAYRSIDDPNAMACANVYRYAEAMTRKELSQAAEALYHNLNSLQSRSGNQLPFSSINFGTSTSPEGKLISKALLEASIRGVGKHHRTAIFPCGVFQYKKGINDTPDAPNYSLKRLALQSTSRRLYPNYVNCDWSNHISQVKEDRDLKRQALNSLPDETVQKLTTILAQPQNHHLLDQLTLKFEDGNLVVDDSVKPFEEMSTMGCFHGSETITIKIGDMVYKDIRGEGAFNLIKSLKNKSGGDSE